MASATGTTLAGTHPTPSRRPPADGPATLTEWCLLAAIGTVVCALWLVRLPTSFLVDETITGWVTSDGLTEAWNRGWNYQGNGPLYFCLLWFWRQALGSSEVVLRLPSVLAMLGATVVVYRLGLAMRDRLTGLTAAFAFVTTAEIVVRATTARPYGLQILFVTVSTAALVRWTRDGRGIDGHVWIIAAVAGVYMHPFAALLVFAHAAYLWTLHRQGQGVPRARLAPKAGLGLLLATPVLPHIADVAERSGSLVISDVPTPDRFVTVLVPAALVGAVAIGALLARSWNVTVDRHHPPHALVLAWALVPTSLLYAVSILGRPVLVGRYFAFTAAGTALVAALILTGLAPSAARVVALFTFAILSLSAVTGLNGTVRQDWRAAVQWGEAAVADRDAVVLVNSALIETDDVSLLDRAGWRDYLAAPYQHYGTDRDALALPLSLSGSGADYFENLLRTVSADNDTIMLVARTDEVAEADYPSEITRRLTAAGWRALAGPELTRVTAVVYTR